MYAGDQSQSRLAIVHIRDKDDLHILRERSLRSAQPRRDLVQMLALEIPDAHAANRGKRMKLQVVTHGRAEKARPRPANRPEIVGVLLVVGMNQFAISRDDVRTLE